MNHNSISANDDLDWMVRCQVFETLQYGNVIQSSRDFQSIQSFWFKAKNHLLCPLPLHDDLASLSVQTSYIIPQAHLIYMQTRDHDFLQFSVSHFILNSICPSRNNC